MKSLGAVGLASALIIISSGCSKEKNDYALVSGKVTIDGQPLESGSITFTSADGATPTGGGTIQGGTYTAKVPPGEKVVLVIGYKVVGQEPLYQGVPDSPMRDKLELVTPEAYNAAIWSPLKASISESSQEGVDFALSKDFKPSM